MRPLIAALALLALTACGQQSPAPSSQAPAQKQESGAVVFGSMRDLPDWILFLRQSDGGSIYYNQRAITRTNGIADIWLQVDYGTEQLYPMDAQHIVHYTRERMHYRFNCTSETFLVAERQIIGTGDEVVARDEPSQIWRALPAEGAAVRAFPIACRSQSF